MDKLHYTQVDFADNLFLLKNLQADIQFYAKLVKNIR